MEIFEIVVGVFSIVGSIAAIVSAGTVVHIKNQISIKGDNNKNQNINQTNCGKNQENWLNNGVVYENKSK